MIDGFMNFMAAVTVTIDLVIALACFVYATSADGETRLRKIDLALLLIMALNVAVVVGRL